VVYGIRPQRTFREAATKYLLAGRRRWDAAGLTGLTTAPLISMLPGSDVRSPYPPSWDEQKLLFGELPAHLGRMALFKVDPGTRDGEVRAQWWDWAVQVPEPGTPGTRVFLIPKQHVKNGEERLVVLNEVARSVVDSCRGVHPEFVFTHRGRPVAKMNNGAWRKARRNSVSRPIWTFGGSAFGKTPALTFLKRKTASGDTASREILKRKPGAPGRI
jgi:hypothetical protein